jgi:hypothetical protein
MVTVLTVATLLMVGTLALMLVDAEPHARPVRPARRAVRLRVRK